MARATAERAASGARLFPCSAGDTRSGRIALEVGLAPRPNQSAPDRTRRCASAPLLRPRIARKVERKDYCGYCPPPNESADPNGAASGEGSQSIDAPRLREPDDDPSGAGMSPRRERGQSIVEFALLAPIMMFLLFAILDLSRVYTAMSSVESAAREAADFGTSLGAERWSATNAATTIDEMQRRACTAASDLPDFAWTNTDADVPPVIDPGEPCTNPSFDWCVAQTTGGPCDKTFPQAVDPANPAATDCDNPHRDPPCTVTVTMSHTFHLFVPLHFDFFGVQLGLPNTLAFQRDSTFAITDINIAPTPGP
jgi:hypothetical protein